MKPVLYKVENGTNQKYPLTDAISCKVTEERNGAFELQMSYPISGNHYSEIRLMGVIAAKPNPTRDIQHFRVNRITKPLNGVVTIYAYHISYDLSGIPVAPFTASSVADALTALKTNSAVTNPFTFWTDKETVATMTVKTPASVRALLGGVEGSVLDTYGGGEYEWDNYTVKLRQNRGENRGVSIRYGKNLTSLEQDENCADVYTGVYPYWADTEGTTLVQLPEKVLNAEGTFDFVKIMTLDLSQEWQSKPTVEQLRSKATNYMTTNKIGVPKVSLKVSFVQLEQTEEYKGKALLERVDLCDTVNVEFEKLGVSATAKCIKTVYDVLLERYDSIELGDAKTTLATTLATQSNKISNAVTVTTMEKAVKSATKQISGNLGGYVILHDSDGNGEPDEILIMDTNNIDTATKVWRWNKSGLGYSSTGYNGQFGLAMTADGAIVADYITTGNLSANLLKAGVLQDKTGNVFKLDLDAGTLDATFSSLKIGTSTVEQIASEKANAAKTDAISTASADAASKITTYDYTLNQQAVFNKLTNNGEVQGFYIQDGKLYINAEYAKIINFVCDHFTSTYGNNTLDAWAATIKLLYGENLTARLYSIANGGGGILQVFSGNVSESEGMTDSDARYSYITSNRIGVGQDMWGAYKGTINAGDVSASGNVSATGDVTASSVKAQSIKNKSGNKSIVYFDSSDNRVGNFDKLSIEGGAAQAVHWRYSSTLGGWLLTTSDRLN